MSKKKGMFNKKLTPYEESRADAKVRLINNYIMITLLQAAAILFQMALETYLLYFNYKVHFNVCNAVDQEHLVLPVLSL